MDRRSREEAVVHRRGNRRPRSSRRLRSALNRMGRGRSHTRRTARKEARDPRARRAASHGYTVRSAGEHASRRARRAATKNPRAPASTRADRRARLVGVFRCPAQRGHDHRGAFAALLGTRARWEKSNALVVVRRARAASRVLLQRRHGAHVVALRAECHPDWKCRGALLICVGDVAIDFPCARLHG